MREWDNCLPTSTHLSTWSLLSMQLLLFHLVWFIFSSSQSRRERRAWKPHEQHAMDRLINLQDDSCLFLSQTKCRIDYLDVLLFFPLLFHLISSHLICPLSLILHFHALFLALPLLISLGFSFFELTSHVRCHVCEIECNVKDWWGVKYVIYISWTDRMRVNYPNISRQVCLCMFQMSWWCVIVCVNCFVLITLLPVTLSHSVSQSWSWIQNPFDIFPPKKVERGAFCWNGHTRFLSLLPLFSGEVMRINEKQLSFHSSFRQLRDLYIRMDSASHLNRNWWWCVKRAYSLVFNYDISLNLLKDQYPIIQQLICSYRWFRPGALIAYRIFLLHANTLISD